MKVLLVNDIGAPVGGAEILTLDLRDALRERGHDARIFASDASGDPNPADYGCHGSTGRFRTLNRVANPRARWRLDRVLADFRPDVVHVRMVLSQLSPLVLPALDRFAALYHAAWYEAICPTGLKLLPDGTPCRSRPGRVCREACLSVPAWVALSAQRAMWDRWRGVFDLYVANSQATRRKLLDHGIEPVAVVHNGVPRRPQRPRLDGPPTVAYAGRLSREKGVDLLAEAFATVTAEVPEARLLVVGDGPERALIQATARRGGFEDRIEISGHLSRSEAEERLGRAWVVAAPSRLEEPFGLAVAEAMMRGTAVVAAGHGGLVEIVEDDRTGIHVRPGDAGDLARALVELLSDRERAEAMGRAGRRRALERFDRDRCAEAFERLYERLVGADART